MNILVLMGRYLPKMSVNSVCMDNIIRQIADDHSITCICYDDFALYVDKQVDIIRIQRDLSKSLQYKLENRPSRIVNKICKFIDKVKIALFLPMWPWSDPIFTLKEYVVAKKIVRNKGIDCVIAIHMPLSSIIVGKMLKVKYPNIQFVPYFLDSLSGGIPISIRSTEWNIRKKNKWERKLLPFADKIVVMESSREHNRKYNGDANYYSRFIHLDIPLLVNSDIRECLSPYDSDCVNVVFCGTANSPMRNMKYFNRIAKALEDRGIVFTIIGECNCVDEIDAKNVRLIQSIRHEELYPYYVNADALLNFGVTVPSAISGKIFEYISYLKPIISTYSIDDEACIPYLKKYPLSLLVDERIDDIKTQADRLYDFVITNKNKTLDKDSVWKMYYNNTPEAFINAVLR